MKKIILALSAIALVVSCSQSRKWTDKERDEVRKVVRDRHDRSAIRHMEAKNYASEPGLLTIVILRGGQATLVYNKGRHITSLTENPLKIHTISQFLEAVPESTHASLYEVIYQDGNLLKWRKGQ